MSLPPTNSQLLDGVSKVGIPTDRSEFWRPSTGTCRRGPGGGGGGGGGGWGGVEGITMGKYLYVVDP